MRPMGQSTVVQRGLTVGRTRQRICARAARALAFLLATSVPAAAAQVDVQFDRAPVHEVLRVLAEAEGINLIVDQGVTGEISMTARGMDARAAMELVTAVRGLHLEQIGNTIIVTTAPTGLSGRSAQPEGASLNFTQRPVGEVLQALAARAGWNLIAQGPLDQEITAWLEGMDPVEALQLVAGAAGLDYQLAGRVLYVKGTTPSPGVRIAVHRLDHVESDRAKELVDVFLPGVRAEVDPATRTLVVQGSEAQLEEAAAFLRSLDKPLPQVLVEARILDVEVDALRALGVEWPEKTVFTGSGASGVLVLDWDPAQLSAALQLLQEQGYSQVLASPKISAVDGQTARMLIGERRPIVTEITDSEGRVFQQVEYIDVGIMLEILPTIAADGSITLDIRTEVSAVDDPSARFPAVRTREATSTVRVQDGRPLIIGGLIQEEERERLRGIPVLSQMPVLGSLFGRRTRENVQTETIIVLVPHVVKAEPGAPLAQTGSAIESTQELVRSLGVPVLSRPEREPGSMAVSIDLLTVSHPAAELQLEREDGRLGYISRIYASTGEYSGAWSVGAAVRYYLAGRDLRPGLRPWIDGGAEYAAPLHDKPTVVYTAGAGFQLELGDNAILELYARFQHPDRPGGLDGLPGRALRNFLSMKLGWRY